MTTWLIVAGAIVVGAFVLWIMQASAQTHSERDSRAAQILLQGLDAFLSKPLLAIIGSTEAIRTYESLRVGEVTRHFDVNTSAAIRGWMSHDLGFHGWGVGLQIGNVGLGTGRLGLSGTSTVSLTSTGTDRSDLTGDGFVAVFEEDSASGVDTLRVVVPSEQETLEFVQAMLNAMALRFTTTTSNGVTQVKYPKSHSAFATLAPRLLAFDDQASYVSDRLNAVLRMPADARPLVTILGQPLSEHIVLGVAIRFGNEDRTHTLFPVSLINTVPTVVQRAVTDGLGWDPTAVSSAHAGLDT